MFFRVGNRWWNLTQILCVTDAPAWSTTYIVMAGSLPGCGTAPYELTLTGEDRIRLLQLVTGETR